VLDPEWDHVHDPGIPISVQVTVSDPQLPEARTYAQWVNFESSPVGPAIELAYGQPVSLSSPGSDIGYWGLYFFSNDVRVAFPPQAAGFPSQEYGFAILPQRSFADGCLEPDSFYGMVQPNIGSDPYLRGGAKTLTWNTTSAYWWTEEIRSVRDANLEELPIASGPTWASDDTRPITSSELSAIEDKFRSYLLAEPTVDEWEFGIEENRGNTYTKPYYFSNLAAKAKRIREVAQAINRSVRFVYQFVNFDTDKFAALIESGAFDHFEILSLHPYRWKQFPSPETWFSSEVNTLRRMLVDSGYGDIEIWITEIGLPVRSNRDPTGFFGYPQSGVEVPGASRDYAARYLVKSHVYAALENIGRVYVYNYQDRGNDITHAEDHFGLRAYTADKADLGFPKQAYVAYVQMLQELHGRKLTRKTNPRENTYVFDYKAPGRTSRLLAWVYPEDSARLTWEELWPAGPEFEVLRVVDLYGSTVTEWDNQGITLTGIPVYVEYLRVGQTEYVGCDCATTFRPTSGR
jgi:hypothetical protein